MATFCLTLGRSDVRSHAILAHTSESFLDRILSFLFPPKINSREDFSTSLNYSYRTNRTGVERNLAEINVVKLGNVTVGEAKPTYKKGTASRRAALISGEI
jgi:hypothetical protein